MTNEELRRLLAELPALPWALWTSNSFRRITGPDGCDGGVLSAYNQQSDGHPDLTMPERQLQALVDLVNAFPGLLDRVERLEGAYNELIMAVAQKHPGETRHETALRYIVERERGDPNQAAAALKEP